MKKFYEAPIVELNAFSVEDVITTARTVFETKEALKGYDRTYPPIRPPNICFEVFFCVPRVDLPTLFSY